MLSIRVKGIDVHYYDHGSGQAVLFLHGWGSDFAVFREFMERTEGRCRVCALDLPGFGQSGEPPAPWSVDDYADFVLDFLAELGVQSVIPVAHSFGGRITIKLAARKNLPVKIPKIVLVDSAGIRPKKSLRQKAGLLFYKTAKWFLSISAIQKKFPDLLNGLRKKRGSADYQNASPRMRECLVKTVNEDLTSCLPLISCPALLVWGDNDTATPVSDARLMERLIPDAGLVVLKNAGHYSFLEQSYTFGKVLDSFLGLDPK